MTTNAVAAMVAEPDPSGDAALPAARPPAARPPVAAAAEPAAPDRTERDDRTRAWAPGAIAPMAAFLTVLFTLPRVVLLLWWATLAGGWTTPPGGVIVAVLGLLLAPLTLIVLLVALAGGSMDLSDQLVVGLAAVSDVLTWFALRFERRYGRDARAGRATRGDDGSCVGECPGRTALQQWLDLLAMALPWPGMRLQAILRRWPNRCTLTRSEVRLLGFLTYDSTARSIYFATPAWIIGILALAVVNNSAVGWQVRMLVAAIGPILTIALIVVVGAQNAQFRVVLPVVRALRVLDCAESCPPTTLEVRRLNRSIARAADALQRLPVRLHSAHPTVIRAAAEKAAAMSALQEIATSGVEETVRLLSPRLREDLRSILEGRWRSLPSAAPDVRVQGLTGWQRACLVVAAAALLGAAGWVGVGGVQWGQATAPLVATLVGLAMVALIRSGVAPGGLQQAIDLGKGAIALSRTVAGDSGTTVSPPAPDAR